MDPRLFRLETELLEQHFAFHPGLALAAGVHRYDHHLEDFSEERVGGFVETLAGLKSDAVALVDLDAVDRLEREVLLARLDELLHEYRVTRSYRRDPYATIEGLSAQLNLLIIFEFAPLAQRLEAVVAKEREIPRFLDVARANLAPAAPIVVDYALTGARGALSLVASDLPRTFATVTGALARDFAEATRNAAAALTAFIAWLEREYPRGHERAYALGAESYGAHLAAGERITTPLAEIDAWATATIATTREELVAACRLLDPSAAPDGVVAAINADHPAPGGVVTTARKIAEEVYRWFEARRLVSFPTTERVRIADTPEFMRWTFGSMWTPGPWEEAPVGATFYATDADATWPRARQDEHLTAFSHKGLENLAIHEAYPGHFIQSLHQSRVSSPLRRTFWWGVFGEGWAHYCEQMAVDEGFGDGAPAVRVVQLQEALTRLCRVVNGIRMHTRERWSFEDGTRYFREQAWLSEAVARAESERAAIDPFYLRYTLGKKLIFDLRAECEAALGSAFDLRAFHDTLLGVGSGPMSAMRDLVKLALRVG